MLDPPRVLILGGTTEAAHLARALEGKAEVTSSLAGRAGIPALPGRVRVGGFGGAAGLEAYLRSESFDAVIDATHPFAARISDHAIQACTAAGIPRLLLWRPDWGRQPGDRWIMAADTAAAARMVPGLGRRAFLTVGAGEVPMFSDLPDVWFLVRLLRQASLPLSDYRVVSGRPPFSPQAEVALMLAHGVDMLVTKASGGAATYGKIQAARELGLPVLMIARPPVPPGTVVSDVAAAVAWLVSRF